MPTRHKRIFVTQDDALNDALARVRAHYPDTPPARLVHDLAVRGAEAVSRERAVEDEALERLVIVSTREKEGALDWSVLEHIDELAWGE